MFYDYLRNSIVKKAEIASRKNISTGTPNVFNRAVSFFRKKHGSEFSTRRSDERQMFRVIDDNISNFKSRFDRAYTIEEFDDCKKLRIGIIDRENYPNGIGAKIYQETTIYSKRHGIEIGSSIYQRLVSKFEEIYTINIGNRMIDEVIEQTDIEKFIHQRHNQSRVLNESLVDENSSAMARCLIAQNTLLVEIVRMKVEFEETSLIFPTTKVKEMSLDFRREMLNLIEEYHYPITLGNNPQFFLSINSIWNDVCTDTHRLLNNNVSKNYYQDRIEEERTIKNQCVVS